MKSPPRARSPTLLRILLYSGFGAENRFKIDLRRNLGNIPELANQISSNLFDGFGWVS